MISSLVGYRKPSPLFFNALVFQTAWKCDELLMISDSCENDILGARDAGIHAIRIFWDKSDSDDEVGVAIFGDLIGLLP